MNTLRLFAVVALATTLFAIGCGSGSGPRPTSTTAVSAQKAHDESDGHTHDGDRHDDHKDEAVEAKIAAELDKLSAEDRQLVEAQKFCAVMDRARLGSMGAPIKFEIKGEPVFVCCSGCKTKALKNPDATLAKVEALKSADKAANQ
jgi:hypothetical protein